MVLTLENICFDYENEPLLHNVNISIAKGEIVTLIGLSGCGKSTLLRLINGLETPKSGTVHIHPDRSAIAYMTQDDLLLPWRTALRNVMLPLELKGAKDFKEAHRLLDELGLKGSEHKFPHELSGGMRQRVALARSLIDKRAILLLDEPFSSLDVILREQFYCLLRELRDQEGITLFLVTHDFYDAVTLSDRIFLLKNRSIDQSWHVNSFEKSDLIEILRKSLHK